MRTALRFQSLALVGALRCAAGVMTATAGVVGAVAEEATAKTEMESEALPGIFAPKRADEPVPLPRAMLARRTGSSERVSAMIAEKVKERVKEFDASALPITRPAGDVSAVVMERFTVKADKVRKVDPDEKLSPAARFLKTGRFFESADGTTTADVKLFPVRPSGALPKEEVMRVEISVSKKF